MLLLNVRHNNNSDAVIAWHVRDKPAAFPKFFRQMLRALVAAESHYVQRWLNNVKKLPTWPKVNEAFYGLVEAVKAQPFNAV